MASAPVASLLAGARLTRDAWLAVAALAAAAGASVKIVGALASGSRALLVDALTCIAGLVGLAASIYYVYVGRLPPDSDHPYGHSRLRAGAVVASLSAYMFVAGVAAAELASSLRGYTVDARAGVGYALLGAGFYAVSIAAAGRADPVMRVYSGFTASEILESLVAAAGSLAGGVLGYQWDLLGGAVILAYIFYEAVEAHKYLMDLVSDRAAPAALYERLRHEALMRGLRPVRVRLRMLDEETCVGDAVVVPQEGMGADIADMLADELAEEMRRFNCDVTIHVAYVDSKKRRG
ncbi:MAG: cation transporter [Crenarchaeota archaeon]|nr:cation transporter [Thermoproteota archaeon]